MWRIFASATRAARRYPNGSFIADALRQDSRAKAGKWGNAHVDGGKLGAICFSPFYVKTLGCRPNQLLNSTSTSKPWPPGHTGLRAVNAALNNPAFFGCCNTIASPVTMAVFQVPW